MYRFKRYATFLVILLLILSFSSCEKQADDLQSVSFKIQNVTNSSKKAVNPQDDRIPVCKDDLPAYVIAKISGVDYKLNVLAGLNDGTETQVLKLDADNYTLQDFKVYTATDELIWAAPISGSYYANLFGLQGVSLDFTVAPFEKSKLNIDVLCWQDYSYKDFGFNWFDYNRVEIKTLCFFGDICVDDYVEWHEAQSPYFEQDYDGYDFPAIFKVIIKTENGVIVNDESVNSNLSWKGEGVPLCIEYPDFVGQDDNYIFEIFLMMPDGNYDSSPYITQQFSAEDDYINITGDDGVYVFAYGICTDTEDPQACETAFAKFENIETSDSDLEIGYVLTNKSSDNPEGYPMLSITAKWGWAGNIKDDGTYTYDIWAAAGKNDTSKGYLVGDLSVTKDGNSVNVTYSMDSGYVMDELHLFAMDTKPTGTANGQFKYGDSASSGVFENLNGGEETQFTLNFDLTDNDGDGIWFIAHSVVCDDD